MMLKHDVINYISHTLSEADIDHDRSGEDISIFRKGSKLGYLTREYEITVDRALNGNIICTIKSTSIKSNHIGYSNRPDDIFKDSFEAKDVDSIKTGILSLLLPLMINGG